MKNKQKNVIVFSLFADVLRLDSLPTTKRPFFAKTFCPLSSGGLRCTRNKERKRERKKERKKERPLPSKWCMALQLKKP